MCQKVRHRDGGNVWKIFPVWRRNRYCPYLCCHGAVRIAFPVVFASPVISALSVVVQQRVLFPSTTFRKIMRLVSPSSPICFYVSYLILQSSRLIEFPSSLFKIIHEFLTDFTVIGSYFVELLIFLDNGVQYFTRFVKIQCIVVTPFV